MNNLTLVQPQTDQRSGEVYVSLKNEQGLTVYKKVFGDYEVALDWHKVNKYKEDWTNEIETFNKKNNEEKRKELDEEAPLEG